MKQKIHQALLLTSFVLAAHSAWAETLARRGALEFTTEDFLAHHYLSAPSKVEALKSSGREVQSTIIEVLAARAYNASPDLHMQLNAADRKYYALQTERAGLAAELNLRERRARAAFNQDDPVVIARAREIWLTDTTRFMSDESADITQIMFSPTSRSFDEISERIKAAQAALAKGESFDTVAKKYTDDPNFKETAGQVKGISITRTDGLMGNLIFKQLKEGEVSVPTPTRTGLHIVRLDKKYAKAKKTFDESKPKIIEQMLEDAAKNARLELLDQLNKVETVVDENAFEAFVGKVDPALEERRREIYRNSANPVSTPPAKP